jgi:hypothetical protein
MERRRAGGVIIALGVLLLIAAVVGFVIVPEHVPMDEQLGQCGGPLTLPYPGPCRIVHYGFSQTLYDAVKIATWAALIVGAVLVALGLIRFARRGRVTTTG